MSKYSDKKRRQAESALAEEARQREAAARPRSEAEKSHADAIVRKTRRRRAESNRRADEDKPLYDDKDTAMLIATCATYAKALVAHGMVECGNTFLELCRRSANHLIFTDQTIKHALCARIND